MRKMSQRGESKKPGDCGFWCHGNQEKRVREGVVNCDTCGEAERDGDKVMSAGFRNTEVFY